MVSLLSTSSVMVLPVKVFTKICICIYIHNNNNPQTNFRNPTIQFNQTEPNK
uniref:Polyubiquitin n=1 Tax=Rhizophora mucronata TaxID=61149 RepID=A0A2P2JIW4_RHIMU